MLVEDCGLRWAGGGPGVGRDAPIAYSSLLGRCMARAYFTSQEGRAWLVPSRRFLPAGARHIAFFLPFLSCGTSSGTERALRFIKCFVSVTYENTKAEGGLVDVTTRR